MPLPKVLQRILRSAGVMTPSPTDVVTVPKETHAPPVGGAHSPQSFGARASRPHRRIYGHADDGGPANP
jgi:hypothetical protein